MIRELMVNGAKNIPANYAAKVAMVTGMGVQIDAKNAQVILPAALTADNLYMVAHEFVPEGLYASITNFDDYDEMVTEIKAGAFVKLIPMYPGELYGTDQYKAADIADKNIGKTLAVGADGKWQLATAASRYLLEGIMADGTHNLAMIRVLDTAVANT